MKARLALFAFLTIVPVALAQQFTPPALPPGAKGTSASFRAEILKTYALEEQGALYRAYVVMYKGTEVVVSDSLGHTTKQIGDKVTVLAVHAEVPFGGKTLKSITFRVLPTP